MSSGVQEGPVRLQKVATEEVRDGAPAPFDCRPATLTREEGGPCAAAPFERIPLRWLPLPVEHSRRARLRRDRGCRPVG